MKKLALIFLIALTVFGKEMFFVGNRSTQTFLFNSGAYSSGAPDSQKFIDKAVSLYGGSPGTYQAYLVNNDSIINRVLNQDEFDLTWSGSTIVGISFATEDAKGWIHVSCSPNKIYPSGYVGEGDTISTVTIEVWNSSNTALNTSINATRDVPVRSPHNGLVLIRAQINNGVATINFKSKESGKWYFTSESVRYNGFRIHSQDTVQVRYVPGLEY